MPKLLKKYQQMRDFSETPEPSGQAQKKKRTVQPMFVVQKHAATRLHYDFRLEMEGVLKSWAVPKGPSYDPGTKRLAMMTEDHPYDYGSFEGVIPAGNYGGGNVIIWDKGTWEFIEPGPDPVKALQSGKLTFRLTGKKLFGEWALIRIKGRSPKGNEWLLLKHRDKYASPKFDVTEEAPLSIISGKDVDEIAPTRTWESHRKTTSGKPRTMADALREKQVTAPRPKPSVGKTEAANRKPAAARKKSTKRSGARTPSDLKRAR